METDPAENNRAAAAGMTRRWHAVYTRSRSEKRLMELLCGKGIEAYVPLHRVVRQWSDRKKTIEEPFIRSYCFVRVDALRYQDVLNTPGAVRYVWFSGKPATIPDRQIDLLKVITAAGIPVETVNGTLPAGTRVRFTGGLMAGFSGELVSHAGKNRVIVRIDHLETALAVSVSPALVEEERV